MTIWVDEPSSWPKTGQRPVIQVNGRQLRDVVDDAWRAVIEASEPPFLFVDDGRLVHRVRLGDAQLWLQHVSSVGLFGILIRVADWVRATPRGLVASKPPSALVAVTRGAPDPGLPRAAPLAERQRPASPATSGACSDRRVAQDNVPSERSTG